MEECVCAFIVKIKSEPWRARPPANGRGDNIFKYPPQEPMAEAVAKTSAGASQWRGLYANEELVRQELNVN